MKSLLSLLSLVILSCSCASLFDDPADKFIGEYEVSIVESGYWGSATINHSSDGVVFISKVSPSRVRMGGSFEAYGDVTKFGIQFEPVVETDSYGIITNTFQECIITQGHLSMGILSSGQLKPTGSNKYYPYSTVISVVGDRY